MKKLVFLSLITLALLFSCKKDPVPTLKDNTVTAAMARDTLYYIMKEWYFWYKVMPDVTKENYSDPYKLLDAMRYKALDRWSFVADYNEFIAEMNGTFVGHGFRIGVDNAGKARIAMIYSNSPLYANGVRRGWIVKSINGTDIAPLLLSGNGTAYTNVIGASEAGITNIFVFTKPDGTDVTISSTKSSFPTNSVLLYDTLHLTTGVTGHLVFESFINPSRNELATAFAFFKTNNIKDLILDLRYNGGGYLDIAQTLASYIGGDVQAGKVFASLTYNDQHPEENQTFNFVSTPSSIGLSRLVVITTRNTASASEAVMNGLKPVMNVVSVGDTTDGKPTGMNGWPVGQKYFMFPVTFKMVNSQNQGEYYQGIFPSKIAPDDITHDFNDRREACLKEAISYLQSGAFTSKSFRVFKNSPQLTEKPNWLNNTFLRNN